jgi:hypothetical protein
MLNQPLMEKLVAMRWQGMVEALKTQEQDRTIHELRNAVRLPSGFDVRSHRTYFPRSHGPEDERNRKAHPAKQTEVQT